MNRYIPITLVALCIIDALFTILIVSNGGVEINPVMNFFININVFLFIVVKMVLTVGGVMFLVAYQHVKLFNIISSKHVLLTISAIYIILIIHELQIILKILPL